MGDKNYWNSLMKVNRTVEQCERGSDIKVHSTVRRFLHTVLKCYKLITTYMTSYYRQALVPCHQQLHKVLLLTGNVMIEFQFLKCCPKKEREAVLPNI